MTDFMTQMRIGLMKRLPLTAWLGLGVMVVLSLSPEGKGVMVWAALATIMFTAIVYELRHAETMDRHRTLNLPVSDIKVQPEGPSFQEVLRAIPDPVMVISGLEPDDVSSRRIVFANKAAAKMFHITTEGGLLVSAIRNPEALEIVDEALFGNISREIDFNTSGVTQDQSFRAIASPLPVAESAAQHNQKLALLVLRDETEARRIARMRADFLANASHELRTPLASLSGFIDTLRGHAKNDTKAQEKFLDIMSTQADRMRRLIYDLLSLSRIEMNEHVPPSGEADIVQSVHDVVEALSLMAAQKKVKFEVIAPKIGLYPIIGDRDQITQVAQNLIDNALKYAPQGSLIKVEVRINQSLKNAQLNTEAGASKLVLLRPDRNMHDYYMSVRVRDEGHGIAREYLPRLAERFYRVEGQKSGDRLGTGLGLAIVKHIINRHRGGLVVESLGPAIVDRPTQDDKLRQEVSNSVVPIVDEGAKTFTAFCAFFPQKGLYLAENETLKLVEDQSEALRGAQRL
jgi:two-component system phosphate regulon sensor histidine kinase PhoR